MAPVRMFGSVDVLLYSVAGYLCWKILKSTFGKRRRLAMPKLRGPASKSLLFGLSRYMASHPDTISLYEEWADEYGPAYALAGPFGSSKIVLTDPKAVGHFYVKDYTYVQPPLSRTYIEKMFGKGIIWAQGDGHRRRVHFNFRKVAILIYKSRQRKAMSPAFSNAAIRRLTSVFFDSSYKLKTHWDNILESAAADGTSMIEVQHWMNNISMDSIGIAGFGHDFQSLDGKYSAVVDMFDSMNSTQTGFWSSMVFILGPFIPFLAHLPTKASRLFTKMRKTTSDIADDLLERMKQESESTQESLQERSVIGLLIKSESQDAQFQMTHEEVVAQINVMLLAGYETTSISLTWALIELSKHQDKQKRLREELLDFASASDPTWEQLSTSLPYLDAVIHEILRLHSPVHETVRYANEDDVIPFSATVTTKDGAQVSSLPVAQGTSIVVPIRSIHRSESFWGPDAKEFRPERWLDSENSDTSKSEKVQELQGHRHLLTFGDGPRICLGRAFALTEFKAALSVLIRNYTFELPEGPKTKIEKYPSPILARPKLAGQDGPKVPLKVKRVH